MTKHRHDWQETAWGVAAGTRGASGRGRTVANKRVCRSCGRKERKERPLVDGKWGRSKWVVEA